MLTQKKQLITHPHLYFLFDGDKNEIDATTLFKGSIINLAVANMLKGISDQTYPVTSLPNA